MLKVNTPHAAVIIWNYLDRVSGDKGLTLGADKIDQTIISTVSVISIATSKDKSAPHGQYELVLAPTKNWVATITPGSWMCILMSQTKITENDLKTVNPKQLKFLGRVDSVRATVQVDPTTAARQTVYRVTGPDWGQIFNTNIYVDPLARDLFKSDISTATRFIYEKQLLKMDQTGIPTSRDNIKALLDIWGSKFDALDEAGKRGNVMLQADVRYTFPDEVVAFLGIKKNGEKAVAIKDAVTLITGNLINYNKYNNSLRDSLGIIQPQSVFGNNNFWQVLNDNSNEIINELICDLDVTSKGIQLSLMNRIKPFIFREQYKGQDDVRELESRFKNVKTTIIDEYIVQNINAGTNWRDKYNFIEIQVDQSLLEDTRRADLKNQLQEYDPLAIQREGFRPLFKLAKYFPPKSDGTIDENKMYKWKYLLRQWFFDIHRMLNGTVTFTGIDEYIRVGDNIMFKAKLIGDTTNITSGAVKNPDDAYILAHVENISHQFNVAPDGARSFFTTVSFVRGIVVNKDRVCLEEGTLDLDASEMTQKEEKNNNTVSTSTAMDPDPKKLKGT